MSSDAITIGVFQASSVESKDDALRKINAIPRLKDRASIIVTPEYMMMDPTGLTREDMERIAEEIDGPYVNAVRKAAREAGACIIANMYEKGKGKIYNSTILVDSSGEIAGVRRKHFLFDAYGYKESSLFDKGEPPGKVFDACGLKVGIAVCFELRFPEVFRHYMLEGAEVFVVPAAWYKGDGKEEALRVLAQARSHENAAYTVVAALYGQRFTGRSMIVNPTGLITVDLGFGEKYREATIDLSEVRDARRRLPVRGILLASEWARNLYGYSSTGTSS